MLFSRGDTVSDGAHSNRSRPLRRGPGFAAGLLRADATPAPVYCQYVISNMREG